MATDIKRAEWPGRSALSLILAVASGWLIPAHASTADEESNPKAAVHQAPRHSKRPSLEDRVRTLSQALDLDAKQQSELYKVLELQRDQVKRIWSGASVPAAYRIGATRAVNDQTEDRIRAMLNDEQKKKFKPPRQPHEPANSAGPSVEDWMNAAKPK